MTLAPTAKLTMDDIEKKLSELAKLYWPKFFKAGFFLGEEQYLHRKAEIVYQSLDNISSGITRIEKEFFRMIYDLCRERFWTFSGYWEILHHYEVFEIDRYALFAIEMAKRSSVKDMGYCWIMANYSIGKLKHLLSDEEFTEAVNYAFWEMADHFYSQDKPIHEAYHRFLFNHAELLDFAKYISSANFNQPLTSSCGWVCDEYITAVKRSWRKLNKGQKAFLARPIIESLMDETIFDEYYDGDEEDEPEVAFKRQLRKYKTLLDEPQIQSLFKNVYLNALNLIDDCYDDDPEYYLSVAKFLREYLLLTDEELIALTSSSFIKKDPPTSHQFDIFVLAKIGFPLEWVDEPTKTWFRNETIEALGKADRTHGKQDPLVPHLQFIREASDLGYIEQNFTKDYIEEHLKKYLNRSIAPAGDLLEQLAMGINEKYIDPPLLEKVITKLIKDLTTRNKKDLAEKLTKTI